MKNEDVLDLIPINELIAYVETRLEQRIAYLKEQSKQNNNTGDN